jgi:hypothetical protein
VTLSASIQPTRLPKQEIPAILTRTREVSAQRLMMAYALTGMFFMILPGTFLGVLNLINMSSDHGSRVSPAWIQAHGHAQIFGWIGTFILGIGFYSLPKMTRTTLQPVVRGWIAWMLWTSGVLLRWSAGVYQWHWRILLPLSATLELSAFLIFLASVRRHRPESPANAGNTPPLWVLSVLIGTVGFGLAIVMNLSATIGVSVSGANPAFASGLEAKLLTLLLYGFIVPTIWGFSARWLPIFLGLRPVDGMRFRSALALTITGVVLAQLRFARVAPWFLAGAALVAISALDLLGKSQRPAKTNGVHASFPSFVRIAYVWLVLAAILGICAAYFDHYYGWIGGSRHALTVGFIATMVFAIGQRVLPAFAGMRVLYSSRLMFISLLLLNIGCVLRVSSEILAYEGYWPPAWAVLPWSAICELMAVTLFAANLILTFIRPPAHLKYSPHTRADSKAS